MALRVELPDERRHDGRLGGPRLAHQHHGAALAALPARADLDPAQRVHEVLHAHRVERRDDQRRVLGALDALGVLPLGDLGGPVDPLELLHVHHVLEQRVLGVLQPRQGRVALAALALLRQLGQLVHHVGAVRGARAGADRPRGAVEEEALVLLGREVASLLGRLAQHRLQQVQSVLHQAHVLVADDGLAGRAHEAGQARDHVGRLGRLLDLLVLEVELEERLEVLPVLGPVELGLALPQPRLHDGHPAQLVVGDVDDARTGHGGRGCVVEVLRLKHRLHLRRHEDAVPVGQRQHLRGTRGALVVRGLRQRGSCRAGLARQGP